MLFLLFLAPGNDAQASSGMQPSLTKTALKGHLWPITHQITTACLMCKIITCWPPWSVPKWDLGRGRSAIPNSLIPGTNNRGSGQRGPPKGKSSKPLPSASMIVWGGVITFRGAFGKRRKRPPKTSGFYHERKLLWTTLCPCLLLKWGFSVVRRLAALGGQLARQLAPGWAASL